MWKRLNNQSRQPAIPDSGYDTTFDESAYGRGLAINANRAQSPPNRGLPAPRPAREDVAKGLPFLPFESPQPVPAHQETALRASPPIYSKPTPGPSVNRFPENIQSNVTSSNYDISPPSSPDSATRKNIQGQMDERDVSPIDEMPNNSRLGIRPSSRNGSKPPPSNIPALRREKRRNQVAQVAMNLVTRKEIGGNSLKETSTADPRWDPYSGEQTKGQNEKPQNIKPGQCPPPGPRSAHDGTGRPLGNQSIITATQKVQKSFVERVRDLKINSPTERPEWKGASGRSAMVSPVADQMHIPPLKMPRKSSKSVVSPTSGSPSPVSVIWRGGDERSTAQAQLSDHVDPNIATIRSNSSRNSPRVGQPPMAISPSPSLKSASENEQTAAVQGHRKSDSAGTIERNFREAFKGVSFPGHNLEGTYVQPPSRFSVTTYAPSEAQSTPRLSTDTFDHPPMPTPPQTQTSNDQPTPILDRKRPNMVDLPKATTRKAVAPPSPVFISMTSSIAVKRQSNIGKSLPQSPAEAQSQDLISMLQAQLEDLQHRRNNITKSIRQMTELMPTDGVLITNEVKRKRESEKLKVEGLREEEADVRRQEHEIGLRLHRAYKRRDKNAEYELTSLWVRRVTG